MTNDQKIFEAWLEGYILSNRTRRQFAIERNIDLADLKWAFLSGYTEGVNKGMEMGRK